ncbi:hypothetical protein ACFWGV_21135, partial [Bacillus subtilis]
MTDHHAHDHGDDKSISNRLDRHQHALDDALDGILDIEAGLREVLVHSRHETAVDALDAVLDVEAGLASVLPPAPQPRATDTSDTAHGAWPGKLLPSLTPADRMALRDDPDVKAAKLHLDRLRELDRSLDPADDLVRSLDRALTRALALVLDLADHDRALAGALIRARSLASDLVYGSDFAPTLDLACDLARTRALDVAHSLAH